MELQAKLDFWLQKNWNVLLIGKHGIGKTSLIKQCFEKAGLKLYTRDLPLNYRGGTYLYFSASTMDVWTDLVGLPEKRESEQLGRSYLDFVLPPFIENVEMIFIDELNRPSAKKLLNSVMELILNRSVNGYRWPKLRAVWAAINPENDPDLEYQVEALDPTQKDRFMIKHHMLYRPDAEYFEKKFGSKQAEAALGWWHELDNKGKNEVSPRCLDGALEVYNAGGDLRDVLPPQVNINKLLTELKTEPVAQSLHRLYENQDRVAAIQFLANENNYSSCIDSLLKNKTQLEFLFSCLSQEKKMLLLGEYASIRKMVRNFYFKYLEEIALFTHQNPKHSWSQKMKREILKYLFFNLNHSWEEFKPFLYSEFMGQPCHNSAQRKAKFNLLKKTFPLVLSSEPKDIIALEKVLIHDLFIPSQKKTLREEMPELIGMLHTLFIAKYGAKYILDVFPPELEQNTNNSEFLEHDEKFLSKWRELK